MTAGIIASIAGYGTHAATLAEQYERPPSLTTGQHGFLGCSQAAAKFFSSRVEQRQTQPIKVNWTKAYAGRQFATFQCD